MVIRLSLVGLAFEILTTILIRSFITNEDPKHYLQWMVYLSILFMMVFYFLTAKYDSLVGLLNAVGSAIAISSFFGFLVALVLVYVERKRASKISVI